MAHPIWTGAVGFDLVTVQVGLYPATEDKTIHFHQFEKDTADRIRYRRSTSGPAKRSTTRTSSKDATSAAART